MDRAERRRSKIEVEISLDDENVDILKWLKQKQVKDKTRYALLVLP
jgi:hypothetical protein